MSLVLSLACGPSSHSITRAARPFFAAPMWSATTATASSSRTIWRTPLTALAAVSSTLFTRPPNTGDCANVAIFTPGGRASMPKTAVPLTFAGRSSRFAGVPISLKSFGSLSATLSGTGMRAASAASSPYVRASSRRRVQHLAALRAAGRRIDIPALGRGRHQHGSRGRTGLAQRLPRPADRVRVAGRLHPQQRIGVELLVGRRMLQPHLVEIHLQLFGDQHRDGRVGALAHFDIGHGQHDLPVGRDADEGVGRERIGAASACAAPQTAG